MIPDQDWLLAQGQDAVLLHFTASAFPENPDDPVGVAVSGGGDSMALLHLMARLAAHGGRRLHAVTVNHGLRPEAADEADLVAQTCAALGVPHETLHWQRDQTKGNLMARARQARYDLMADWATVRGIARIALGHTADDQAETFVMRLGRRAGVDGLAAMADRFTHGGVTFCRPLLRLRRADLRACLTRNGQAWCEDPTNDDASFERTRARRALEVMAGLGIDAGTLSSVSGHLAMARAALVTLTGDAARDIVTQDRGDLIWPHLDFMLLPLDIRRRLLQSALRWISGAQYPDRADGLSGLQDAIGLRKTATLGGCLVTAERKTVRLTREWSAVRARTAPAGEVWDGRWRMIGPAQQGCEVRALSETGLAAIPAWRDAGMPRASLAASPALWQGDTLIAAPLAGLANGWSAHLEKDRDDFAAFLLSH